MIKTLYQGDQDELLVQCAGQMSNLVHTDRLYKQAASSCFPANVLAQNAPDKDHFMLHVVAIGAHPRYMPNRNGDAFTREDLLNTHDTFVKFAKFYREHKNTDPDNNLGIVKASAYNHDLDRVELLVHGNKERAEEEYELAKRGSELSVSMSCKVKHDRCSCCGNEARNLDSYCDHLKDNMNQYMPEFRKYAFAFNPNPKFFDISRVRRPADRIAHYLEYVFGDETDSLQKAASEVTRGGIVIPGAVWAKYQGFDDEDTFSLSDGMEKLAQALADKEQWFEAMERNPVKGSPDYEYAFGIVKKASNVEYSNLPKKLEELLPATLFRKMARAGVIMPFDMFTSYIEGRDIDEVRKDPVYKQAAANLPTLFTQFIKESAAVDMEALIQQFTPASENAEHASTRNPDEIDGLMEEMEEKHSCCLHHVKDRVLGGAAQSVHDPRHTHCAPTATCQMDKTAAAYACYQLQILSNMNHGDAELLGVIGNNRFGVKKD